MEIFETEVTQVMCNEQDQNDHVIENSHELIKHIVCSEKISKSMHDRQIFFRGHRDWEYKLNPSLFRNISGGSSSLVEHEPHMIREIILSRPEEFESDRTTLDKLARMQHFDMPTRLLDLTSNPLIALFFACHNKDESSINKKDSLKSNVAKDGEVAILGVKPGIVKFYDSDTVSCLANLSLLDRTHYKAIEPSEAMDELEKCTDPDGQVNIIRKFNKTEAVGKWLHHIKDEKPYFKDIIDPRHVGQVLCVRSKWNNNRISFQSGAFLLFGKDATLPEKGNDDFKIIKIKVKSEAKENILHQLDLMNINASNVYPLLENTAQYLTNKYKNMLSSAKVRIR